MENNRTTRARATHDESVIGNTLKSEGPQKYVMKIEKDDKEDLLKLIIEDSIKRYDLRFKPCINHDNYSILYAEGENGMLAKGPELRMEIIEPQPSDETFHME